MDTSWGLATINKQQISTQGMVIAGFEITDSRDRTRWFEETFLIADIPQPVVLGMPFLKLGNPDVSWTARTLHWRQWDAETALMTTNRVDIIDPEDFIQQVLEESIPAFICHVIMVDGAPPEVHPSRRAQISSTTAETVTLPEAYKDFEDVFSIENAGHLPPHEDHDHAIDLIDGKQPPYGPIYSLSENELSILRAYIDKNLANGFIRPSKSPSGAPILFVPKPNGGLRLCVDYRGLNNLTIKNRYPLPLVGKSLDRLGRAKQFTKLDLTDVYYWIRIKKGGKWKTAFRTRYGHYEYYVMPFSLANAPATFQSYINKCLAKKLDVFCIVYLDDILIYTSEKGAKHKEAVRWVLEQLRKYGLYANLKKCRFGTDEVHFLGYIVSPSGIHMEPERIESIKNWPEPQSIREIQVFIGFANFYRRFIRNFSAIAGPLTSMLKTGPGSRSSKPTKRGTPIPSQPNTVSFLTPEAKKSFQKLKKAFCKEPVLQHFDVSKPIRLETDASGKAIGGVLCQQDTDMNWHPVAYYSRKMLPAERNYETHDAELLAIVEGFKTWRHYLEGAAHTILVLTDHNNLKKFMETTRLSGRQIRWAQELSQYDFKIDYRPGSKNPADALSRPLIDEDAEKKLVEQNRKILDKLQQSLSENNHSLLNANYRAVTQSTICDENNYSREHCTKMLKVLIAGIIASPKLKKL